MNIINGIASKGSPCVLVPPSLDPEEKTLCGRGKPVSKACDERTQICIVGERIWGLKR